jgi:hypothetical protein
MGSKLPQPANSLPSASRQRPNPSFERTAASLNSNVRHLNNRPSSCTTESGELRCTQAHATAAQFE